jgi:UDP-N-acetyl-D-glucosamine dehydrogenase
LRKKVAVVGLGYVGLPLLLEILGAGFKVLGIDISKEKILNLKNGVSGIEGINGSEILKQINDSNLQLTTDFSLICETNIIVICVPTPLAEDNEPDLSFVTSAVTSISKFIQKGTLLIIESTVAPGMTRNLIVPLLEKDSGLNIDNFHIVFSPERIDPLNKDWNIRNTPKLIAGLTPSATTLAEKFYSNFIRKTFLCSSLEIAETAKLLENSFRLINISFINELSIFCQRLGIEVGEVISSAATKPYGFMPFYPSIGVGGHCIPVDPFYLTHKAREIGAPARLIEIAEQINKEMPRYFVKRAEELLHSLKEKRILVVGVSYKPNISDVRETPAKELIAELKNKGAEVYWHDDLVKKWGDETSVALSNDYDLAIIATPHDYLDLTKLGNISILNTRKSI